MRFFSRRLGSAGFAITIAAALTTLSPEAHANSGLDGLGAVIITGLTAGALGIVNIGLTFPDVGYTLSGERQPKPLAITKIVLCAPQAVFYHGLTFYSAIDGGEEELTLLATFGAAWTGAMTTSAIWSLADDIDPASLYGISWAIGTNSAFTAAALGNLFSESPWKGRIFGIAEMASMVPTIAVSAIRLADPTSAQPAWGALAGWSGLLFVHGLATTIRKDKPSKSTKTEGDEIAVPRIHFGPTLVTDGVRQVPGLMIAGKF
jgi:hypothetical protein